MEIIEKTHNFPSSDGRSTVHAVVYLPQGTPKGILQISHGMAEHIGRYDEFAQYICKQGYIVCGSDHIGHGKTAKSKEDLGYLAPRDGFSFIVTDLHLLTIYMKGKFPGIPYFLLGHSMGSFAARIYVEKYGKELSGAIISGTGAGQPILPIAARTKKMAGSLGGKTPSKILDKLDFGNFNAKVEHAKTLYDWLSRDELRVADYITDPLCGFVFSASAFGDLFCGMHEANRREWYEKVPKDLPILMISGDCDPVGDYGKGVRLVYEKLRSAGQRFVEINLYEGGRHEMLNEVNRDEVFCDITRFLDRNCK